MPMPILELEKVPFSRNLLLQAHLCSVRGEAYGKGVPTARAR